MCVYVYGFPFRFFAGVLPALLLLVLPTPRGWGRFPILRAEWHDVSVRGVAGTLNPTLNPGPDP